MSPTQRVKRPVIGMVTSGPLMEMCEEQWLGVSDAAQANDCDLICFVGRELGHPDRRFQQANAIYDLVSTQRLDALVVWTTRIGLLVDDETLARFLRRFAPLPIVTIEKQVAACPTVLMDNRAGMAEAVGHLIEVHGQRRISFVRGPATAAPGRRPCFCLAVHPPGTAAYWFRRTGWLRRRPAVPSLVRPSPPARGYHQKTPS